MNNGSLRIADYNDLLKEKQRLETLIENQKNIIRHDLDELKAEFKKEIKPAVDAAAFVKRLARPQTRNETVVGFGAYLLIDIALKRIFKRSNVVVQILAPKIIKNLTGYMLQRFQTKPSQQRNKIEGTYRQSQRLV